MTKEKCWTILDVAVVITAVLFFLDSDAGYAGLTGFLKTCFELSMMTVLIFIIIFINFFAISFVVRRIKSFMSPKV